MPNSSYNPVRDERAQALSQWLQNGNIHFNTIEPCSGDASSRRYFRLHTDNSSLIAVDDPPPRNSIARFIAVQKTMTTAGLHVPKIYRHSEHKGFMLLQDFGNKHYLDAIQEQQLGSNLEQTSDELTHLYTDAIEALQKIQRHAPSTALEPYSGGFMRAEMHLFVQWYVNSHLKRQLTKAQLRIFENVITLCIENARDQPVTFVHRDYHSRNLMIQSSATTPAIIDFQDALAGPVSYDCVSLLRDCYVELPEPLITKCCEFHRLSLHKPPSSETYQRWFDLMGLQRHIKVMGIFARLSHRDGKHRYLADLPRIWRHIQRVIPRYPELHHFGELLPLFAPENQ